eukprot:scaffold304276_cov35-Attheya_sp.AAC.2
MALINAVSGRHSTCDQSRSLLNAWGKRSTALSTRFIIESLTGNSHDVAPVFLELAYRYTDQDIKKKTCLAELLHSFSLFDSAGKHLENVSKWYDLLLASLRLQVVHANSLVYINSGSKGVILPEWYHGLKFQTYMSPSEEALERYGVNVV